MKIAVSGKGGVGKTTFSALLIRTMDKNGKHVLAIDADPDANLAAALGIADAEKTVSALDVYHAGTRRDADGGLVTAGGRVLAISARAGSLEEAVARAYAGVEKISFDGMIFRRDIGSKGIERLKKQAS